MVQNVEYFKNQVTDCVNMDKMKQPRLSIALILALSVTFFYGCTVQQGQSLLSSKTSELESAQKVLDKVPFAYDMAIDTISYNSCVGVGLNTNGLHGIKLGANEGFVDQNGSGATKGGLKLRSDFIDYVAKNVDPAFPATSVSPSQIQFLLQNTKLNKDLQIQYAVRSTTDLKIVQDIIQPSGTDEIVMNRDGVYLGTNLSEDPLVTAITKNVQFGPNKTVLSEGPRVYNLSSKSSPEPIEASLGFTNSIDESFEADPQVDDGQGAGEDYAEQVRSRFNSQKQILAITFGNPATVSSNDTTPSQGLNTPMRKSETDLKKAFGKGYELTFVSRNAAISSHKKNILNRVIEKNLEDGKQVAGATWACESFLIMKTNHFNNKKITEPSCSELTAADLTNSVIASKVKLIRRHYDEGHWGIGFFYDRDTVYNPATRVNQPLCLVNKVTECYLPTVGIILTNPTEDIGVQYNVAAECYLSRFNQMGVTYSGNKTGDDARRLGRCPQYASICTRTSTSF